MSEFSPEMIGYLRQRHADDLSVQHMLDEIERLQSEMARLQGQRPTNDWCAQLANVIGTEVVKPVLAHAQPDLDALVGQVGDLCARVVPGVNRKAFARVCSQAASRRR